MGPIKDYSSASYLYVSVTGSVPLFGGAGEEAQKKVLQASYGLWSLTAPSTLLTASAVGTRVHMVPTSPIICGAEAFTDSLLITA